MEGQPASRNRSILSDKTTSLESRNSIFTLCSQHGCSFTVKMHTNTHTGGDDIHDGKYNTMLPILKDLVFVFCVCVCMGISFEDIHLFIDFLYPFVASQGHGQVTAPLENTRTHTGNFATAIGNLSLQCTWFAWLQVKCMWTWEYSNSTYCRKDQGSGSNS